MQSHPWCRWKALLQAVDPLPNVLSIGGTRVCAQVVTMSQLQLWTRCCEVSVANSIHDCFSQDLIADLLGRAGLKDDDTPTQPTTSR